MSKMKNALEDANIRLYDAAVVAAKNKAGGESGWSLIGPNIRRALVGMEILAQQERFNTALLNPGPELLIETTSNLYTMMNDQFPWED